ncbi:MAG TPA: DUF2066 domain-containing protein [Steroidobacteraceae bacterium]|nr:DUF2066 domain-containing protein [Steroidobacteraceae bacterium]
MTGPFFARRIPRPPWRCLWVIAGLLWLADSSAALTRVEIYQATVPLTDRSEAAQESAFEAALRAVLIKATGRRTADQDPALAPLIGSARRYVQQYRGAPNSQLWVAFDGAAIARWLTQNSQPLWGRERPTTFVWLAVQTGPQAGTVITAEDTSQIKADVDSAASQRGVPIMWPSASDLQHDHIDYAAVAGGPAAALADLAHRLGGEGTLVGRAAGAADGAAVRWTYLYQDRSSEFSGSPAEGIDRAADTYAGLYAVSGTLAPVDIEVTGITDLKDYASIQSYLESLSFISHVAVESLSGDAVRFRLTTRGGAETLEHALTLDGRLQSIAAGENGIQRFQLQR